MSAHPRHLLLAALVAGLALGPRVPGWAVALVVAAAVTVAGRRPVGALAALFVVVGALIALARVAALEHSVLARHPGAVVGGDATLLDAPRASPFGGWSATAQLAGERVLLRVAVAGLLPQTGDVVRVSGRVRPASGYARSRRAHVEVRTRRATPTGRRRGGPLGAVDALRRRAERILAGDLPPPEAGLLRGMVLGDDTAMPEALREDFRTAGLTHLVAASGANVALLAALILAAAGALGVPFVARWLCVAGAIAVYVPLAGGGPSILRAGLMGGAVIVALLAGRPASRSYALLIAAAVTLVLDPRSVADPGWQLSFAAVTGLLLRAAVWRDRLAGRGVPGAVAEAAAVTAIATLATAPLIAWHFGRVSPVSLPANLLVAPLVAPIMWLGLLSTLAGAVSSGTAHALVTLTGYPVAVLVAVARAAARAPGATLALGPVLVTVIGAALVAAVESRRARRPLLITLAVTSVGVAVTAAAGLGAAVRSARGPAGELPGRRAG